MSTNPRVKLIAQMAALEQGGNGQVICELTQQNPFEGTAKAYLYGLPANVTAEPKDIKATDDKVIFDVVATAKAQTNQTNGLTIETVMKK